MPRVLSLLKNYIVPDVEQARRIPFGLYRGTKLNVNLAHQTQLYFGLWEAEVNSAVRKGLQDATWFIDVGAGAGEMCVLAAAYPKMQRIIAIDANIAEAGKIRDNIGLNDLRDRIEVVAKFAGPMDGTTTVSIDAFDLPFGPGFIKIDVDGAELEVLNGCRKTLSERKLSLLVETHSNALEIDCIELLRALGYTCTIIPQAWWRAIGPEKRSINHNRLFFAEQRWSGSTHTQVPGQ